MTREEIEKRYQILDKQLYYWSIGEIKDLNNLPIEQIHKDMKFLLSECERLEKMLTIKILENAKGAQVLSNLESRIREFEEGIRKHKLNSGYGGGSHEGNRYSNK